MICNFIVRTRLNRFILKFLLACVITGVASLVSIASSYAADTSGETGRPTKVTLPTANAKARAAKSGDGFPTTIVVVGAALAACGAAAGGVVIARRNNSTLPAMGAGFGLGQTAVAPSTVAHPAAPVGHADDAAERAQAAARTLARTLIDLRDRVTSDAIKAEIGAALEQADVHEHVVQPGTPFDPRVHVGIDTTPVTDAAWDQRVATTERPGYFTGNTVLRQPAVVVCRYRPATPGEQ